MNRQEKFQNRMRERGRCIACGRRRAGHESLCPDHAEKQDRAAEKFRRIVGSKLPIAEKLRISRYIFAMRPEKI